MLQLFIDNELKDKTILNNTPSGTVEMITALFIILGLGYGEPYHK